jgi:hypothetical protein
MKNAVFWDVMICGSFKNRRFRGIHNLHHQGGKNQPDRNSVSSNYHLVLHVALNVRVVSVSLQCPSVASYS